MFFCYFNQYFVLVLLKIQYRMCNCLKNKNQQVVKAAPVTPPAQPAPAQQQNVITIKRAMERRQSLPNPFKRKL